MLEQPERVAEAELDQLLEHPQLQESRVLAAIYMLRDRLRSQP